MKSKAAPLPEKARWTLLRAGLQNIWEYDSQTFVCHKGRLLLRGRNESGKTKALEVLFPFLLDADLSPQRIDPFGSTARQMRYNLIHEGNPDVNVCIGYVWMEFGRLKGTAEEYFTIGAGLRATRSHDEVTPWFFAASCRVGVDFNLLADTREPLTRKALEETLQGRGHVWEREKRSEYRRSVQKTLFGLPDDQYSALVNTLIRLRRPQLSNKLNLQELSELLTASLPPLEEGVIRPIAEGFERLDSHHAQKDAVKRNLNEVREFEKSYRVYLRFEASLAAQSLTSAESAYHKARESHRKAVDDRAMIDNKRKDLERDLGEWKRERTESEGRLDALRSSEDFRAVEALGRAESEVARQEGRVSTATSAEEDEKATLQERQKRRAAAAESIRQREKESELGRAAARKAAGRVDLEAEHLVIEKQPAKGAVEAIATERLDGIAIVEKESAKVTKAESESKVRRAVLAKADAELLDAQTRVKEAERKWEFARQSYLAALDSWRSKTRVLGLMQELDLALSDDDLERVPTLVHHVASARHAALNLQLEEAAAALRKAEEEAECLRNRLIDLAGEKDLRPPGATWRTAREDGRPGAPFYLLCEFSGEDPAIQAGIEAALESGGILDAWVTPEGEVLDSKTEDVLFESDPVEGRTLFEYLKPVERGGVSVKRVESLLRTVRVVTGGKSLDDSCSVSTDGRWSIGPLSGAWSKPVAAYIGQSARDRERNRRRIELEGLLVEQEHQESHARTRRNAICEDIEALNAEVLSLPSLTDIQEAAHKRAATEEEAGRRRGERDKESRLAAEAEKELSDARSRRDAAAVKHRLTAWIDRLPELRGLVSEYRAAALESLQAKTREEETRGVLAQAEWDCNESQRKHDTRDRELEEAKTELDRLRSWMEGLRTKAGAASEIILGEIRELDERIRTIRKKEELSGIELRSADTAAGAAQQLVDAAEKLTLDEDGRRKAAECTFREFALEGLLEAAGLRSMTAVAEWSSREALLEARRVDAETKGVNSDPSSREALQNKVTDKYQDLQRALPPDIKVTSVLDKGIWRYPCRLNGRLLSPAELVESLRRDVEERERRLGEDERELLERFLSGEARQHLQDRLRGAHDLVFAMNAQIETCPTASGTRVRLKWEPSVDAAPGTRKAIDLLFKNASLLTEADRKAIKEFLQDRLEQARTSPDQSKSLMLRMSDILDYRKWHAFTVLYKDKETDWKPLTRKTHEAGSGGKKAMMLHLPLFAAAAAFYGSASKGSARLIALDEAFAGIDKPARGELMGLLGGFDLDFLMTSHEEWGFYAELDGLSTYHLMRESGCKGVLAERFVWDGKAAEQVEE